jgi:hypothetical protein
MKKTKKEKSVKKKKGVKVETLKRLRAVSSEVFILKRSGIITRR